MAKLSRIEHLNFVLKSYEKTNSSEKTAKILCEKFKINYTGTIARTVRRWNRESKDLEKIEKSEVFKEAENRKHQKNSKYYIITAAQNATSVNMALLENIEAYAKHIGAEIEVIPFRYRNPTTTNEKTDDEWWDKNIVNHLIANRHSLHKNLQVLADIKVQPTACMPLSGLEGVTGIESSIIGHPRQHFKILPTLDSYPKKIMLSTGVLTNKNYSASKAGKKGEFHHTLGFVIVEIKDNDIFYVRHISAKNDGSFYDLDNYIDNKEVFKKEKSVSAIVLGDLHLGEHCDESLKTTYKMLDRFSPKNIFLHDVFDGKSVNHHELNNPFIQIENEKNGTYSLENELKNMLNFLKTVLKYNPVIVAANHNDFVDRWLLNMDFKRDRNKYEFLKYAKLKTDGQLEKGIVSYEVEKEFGKRIKCLTTNDSYRVKGIELAVHGHLGASGSRGGEMQFKRLNTKMVVGHTHSPSRLDNVMTVGTLTKLRVGYNNGLSSWLNSNVIIHSNGKMQNLIIINGEYTTL